MNISINVTRSSSVWSSFVSSVRTGSKVVAEKAAESMLAVEKKAKDLMPDIKEGAHKGLVLVDGMCMKSAQASVAFLVKYPGIAAVLSPSTILKMAAAQQYENMAGGNASAERVTTIMGGN